VGLEEGLQGCDKVSPIRREFELIKMKDFETIIKELVSQMKSYEVEILEKIVLRLKFFGMILKMAVVVAIYRR